MIHRQGIWAAGLSVAALAMVAAPAWAKTARCVIQTADGGYAGGCSFSAAPGGSFHLSPAGRAEFFSHEKDEPGITDLSVDVDRNVAEVRGLTTFGVNSRWGRAKRSAKDRACWIGDDFSICVY